MEGDFSEQHSPQNYIINAHSVMLCIERFPAFEQSKTCVAQRIVAKGRMQIMAYGTSIHK